MLFRSGKSLPSATNNRFRQTIDPKAQPACQPPVQPVAQQQVTSTTPLVKATFAAASVDLLQMVEKPIGADLDAEGNFTMSLSLVLLISLRSSLAMEDLETDIDNEFFTTW